MTRWRRLLWAWLCLYSLGHLSLSILFYNPIAHPAVAGDFSISYQEAAHWRQTGELVLLGPTNVSYTPLYYLILRPFTFFPYSTVSLFLYLAQFPLFAYAILLMARSGPAGTQVTLGDYGVAALLTVNFQPFLETVAQHKVEGLEFFLICAGVAAFKKRRDLWTGISVAGAAALKYLPGILALHFLLKRELRVILGILLGLGLYSLVCLGSGWKTGWSVGFLHPLNLLLGRGPETNHLVGNIEWQSLSGTINRWFARPDPGRTLADYLESTQRMTLANPSLAHGLALGLKALLWGLYLFWVRRRWSFHRRDEVWPWLLLEISLSLVMIVITLQAVRIHYGILLLPAFVFVGLLLRQYGGDFGLKEKVLFGIAYGLSGMVIPGGLLNRLPAHPLWGQAHARAYQWFSLPFYGYLLLGLCILLCYHKLSQALVVKREKVGWIPPGN